MRGGFTKGGGRFAGSSGGPKKARGAGGPRKGGKPAAKGNHAGQLETLGGPHAVSAALWAGARPQYGRLLLQNDLIDHFGAGRNPDELMARAKARGLQIETRLVPKQTLDNVNPHHRGVALEVGPLYGKRLNERTRPEWQRGSGRTAVLLDQLQDTQNLGAILRTAWFLGVDDVLISSKKSAPLSETVARVSAGALDMFCGKNALWEIVGSSAEFLDFLRENKWRTVATRVEDEHTLRAEDLSSDENVILVMGSEGSGVRPQVMDACTDFMSIPGRRDGAEVAGGGIVDSLNVSVAFGILAASLVKRG
mmetsp:Transcript_17425/g.34228  ORF Transcript_17425/g.34228 Transcript_17425/m.34228 type:complete len:308 (+) Transcript_17425:64-987(+)